MFGIIRNLFVALSILLYLAFCTQGNPVWALFAVFVTYGIAIYKIIKGFFHFITHPIYLIQFCFFTLLRFLCTLIRTYFYPSVFFLFAYPLTTVVLTYADWKISHSIGLCSLLLAVLFILYAILITYGYAGIGKIYLKGCWLTQFFSNHATKAYAKAMDIHGFHYKSPEEYVWECEQDDVIDKDGEKKEKHKTTILDIQHKDELMILNFYQKDFTKEDLVHRRNELIKKNHPDNFPNEKDKEEHERITREILHAYQVISKAVE